MARVPCKHLLVVAVFIFFFISTTARGKYLNLSHFNYTSLINLLISSININLVCMEFLNFFFFLSFSARNMPVAPKETQKLVAAPGPAETEDHDGAPNTNVDELVSMDYTPATRKPPIHN